MKMAAAEALYETEQPASFSVLTIGTLDGSRRGLLASRSHGCCPTWRPATGTVRSRGINDLQARVRGTVRSRASRTQPIIPVTYWTFRLMIGFGLPRRAHRDLVPLARSRGGRAPTSRWFVPRCGRSLPLFPLARQRLRLDLHRDGPAAVGGLRRCMQTARRRARRASRTGGSADVADGVHAPLRGARRGRGGAARQVRPRAGSRRHPKRTPSRGPDKPLAFAY